MSESGDKNNMNPKERGLRDNLRDRAGRLLRIGAIAASISLAPDTADHPAPHNPSSSSRPSQETTLNRPQNPLSAKPAEAGSLDKRVLLPVSVGGFRSNFNGAAEASSTATATPKPEATATAMPIPTATPDRPAPSETPAAVRNVDTLLSYPDIDTASTTVNGATYTVHIKQEPGSAQVAKFIDKQKVINIIKSSPHKDISVVMVDDLTKYPDLLQYSYYVYNDQMVKEGNLSVFYQEKNGQLVMAIHPFIGNKGFTQSAWNEYMGRALIRNANNCQQINCSDAVTKVLNDTSINQNLITYSSQ